MTSFGSSSTKLCILAFLIIISGQKLAFSQKQATNIFKANRQFIGLQANPYYFNLGDISYHRYNSTMFGFKYGMELLKKTAFGAELSVLNYEHSYDNSKAQEVNIGLFGRHILLGKKNVQFLIESGLYYQYGKYRSYILTEPNWNKNKPGWYAATGLGINLYKKKVTLDLMVKYSPDVLFESQHFVPTYKLNYHF
jgi:hypothetical protein